VTAVTTAGLLAGLFGSAFMPAARAAITYSTATAASTLQCDAADTDVEVQGTADGTCYAAAGTTVSVTVTVTDAAPLAEEQYGALSIDGSIGATIVGYTPDAEVIGFSLVNANNTVNFSVQNAAGAATSFKVQVKAPAAGSAYTYTLYTSTTSLGVLTIIGAAAGTTNVPSAATSKVSKPCAGMAVTDAGDVVVAAADDIVVDTEGNVAADDAAVNDLVAGGGSLCTASLVPVISASDAGGYVMQIQIKDAFGNVVTSAVNGQIRATITGNAGVNLGDTYVDEATLCASDSATSALLTPDGKDYLCIKGDGEAGSATVTITSGTVTFTRTVKFLGAVASITIAGPTHMTTNDSNTDVAFQDGLSVVCKDDAGTVIGDGGGTAADYETGAYSLDGDRGACSSTNLSFSVKNSVGASVGTFGDDDTGGAIILTAARVASEFSDENNGATIATASEAKNGLWDIPAAVCAEGEEGNTRKIMVSYAALLEDSNEITVTCVTNKVKVTGLTALATGTSGSATSGANGQTIKVSVAATDGNGRPAGTGSSFTFTTVGTGGSTSGATASFGGGSATLTITLGTTSGAQYVLYSATDGDQVTTGAQAFAQKISFTVSNSGDALVDYALTKSGAKVTGSNFASRATVKVEVENASKGTVKVYTRKANAAGKVVYTIAGRGTFYVTMYTGAAGAEVLSNTVTVKR
jgi:hypothetical protein